MEKSKDQSHNSWSVAEGVSDDLPVILRYRSNLNITSLTTLFPHLITIQWTFKNPALSMLPSFIDKQELDDFEESLWIATETNNCGMLTVVITSNGYRNWYVYVKNIDKFSQTLSLLPQKEERYPIEIFLDRDEDWQFYREIIANIGF
jgi:hypothetical protein